MTAPTNGLPVSFAYGRYYTNGVIHKGTDFSDGKEGHRVMAVLPGVVTHAGYGGWGSAYGQHVIVRSVWQGRNIWVIFAHLKGVSVRVGESLDAGEVLGLSGGAYKKKYSGNSTGPHVHVQACWTNRYSPDFFNPTPIFNFNPGKPTVATYSAPLADKLLPKTYREGAVGPAVTWLGQRLTLWLNAYRIDPPYSEGPGPTWGPADKAAVKLFQVMVVKAKGAGADGYPGVLTLTMLNRDPSVAPAPPKGLEVEYISANLAGYDAVRGEKNRVARSRTTIPDYLESKAPLWFHFQECAIDMFPELDEKFQDYKRVGAGGKGRESYYRRGEGVTVLEARLLNVKHMLAKDTKEFLVIAWEKDGFRAVDVNFHNENEGDSIQLLQLRDIMTEARSTADRLGIPRANIAITGDGNTKRAAAYVWAQGWGEAIKVAKKKIDLQYKSTNGWVSRLVLGDRIDVDVFQKTADVLEAEQLFGKVIADHWPHRVRRRLVKG